MKKILVLTIVILFTLPVFGQKKEKSGYKNRYKLPTALSKEIQNWPKEKLTYLSSVYLSLGERFHQLKHERDAKACFLYSIQVYPIGEAAQAAKALLKKYWDIQIP
jgi:hypothetical protein